MPEPTPLRRLRPLAIEDATHVRLDWQRDPATVVQLAATILHGEDLLQLCGHALGEDDECPDGAAGCRFVITGDDVSLALARLAAELGGLGAAMVIEAAFVPPVEDGICGN